MNKNQFTPISENQPEKFKHLIVSNNINAKNAHGEMSHIWMTNSLQHSNDDGYLTFDAADREIIGITHWKYA